MASEEMHGFDPEVVHRYFDGDLTPEEIEEAEAILERSEEARALLARMARSRALLRVAADEWEGQLAPSQSEDLFARISAAIDEGAGGSGRAGASVHAIGEARGRARRRRGLVAGIGVAFAAAAAVAFAVLGGPGASQGTGAEVASRAQGSEVIAVDFGRSTGTLFNVEGQAGQPLAVVWISDQVEKP